MPPITYDCLHRHGVTAMSTAPCLSQPRPSYPRPVGSIDQYYRLGVQLRPRRQLIRQVGVLTINSGNELLDHPLDAVFEAGFAAGVCVLVVGGPV